MAAPAPADEAHNVVSMAIDADFYRTVYPDAGSGGLDPVTHYTVRGWREGRDPAPWFSVGAYLAANPDVADAGLEPLRHFLTLGRAQGREVWPSRLSDTYLRQAARAGRKPAWRFPLSDADLAPVAATDHDADAAAQAQIQADRAVIAAEFDSAFYLAAHADVAASDMEPIDHFLIHGWLEGRDPNARFSVKDYLETYPDIATAKINPFVHFVRAGRAEGRVGRNQLGFRYEIISRLRSMEDRVADVLKYAPKVPLDPASSLAEGLARGDGPGDLHITFSHDDYTANLGGLQLCLQREGARVRALGVDHLHIYPAAAWPIVRPADAAGQLGVLLNGERLGVFAPADVVQALGAAASARAGRRTFAIHSLLGHDPDETADILAAADLRSGFFWLHDFASLCAGFHLMRNDVEDCAAPPPDSAACGVCVYGSWREKHLTAHGRLFDRLSLTVVSPSQPTLDLWRRAWRYPAAGEVVLPHAALVPREAAPAAPADRPFRLAFVGVAAAHKGWNLFTQLVEQYGDDPRYQFLHLGARTPGGLPIAFHPVTVTLDDPAAMQAAIARLEIDAVLIWPLCRETFSFAAYEAVAGGAAVVTGPDSGNVAAFVQATGHGRMIASEQGLAAALAEDGLADLARAVRKPMLYDLAYSGLSAELFDRETAA